MINSYGLLWFSRADPPETAIRQAAVRFTARLGGKPVACFVHPDCQPPAAVDGLPVEPLVGVLKHHYWLVGAVTEN